MNTKLGRAILRLIGITLAFIGIGIGVYTFNHPNSGELSVLPKITYLCIVFSILLALVLDKFRNSKTN